MITKTFVKLEKASTRIGIRPVQIREFCRRWKVREMALFGSILRDEFRSDSDVDVLVSFSADAPWSLFDLITMQDELEKIFQRPVDLVEREGLRNPFRRQHILNNMEIIYGPANA